MRVAVTGAQGRLGSALIPSLNARGDLEPLPWDRSEFDLDAPESAADLLLRDRPEVVIHAAAWTDVDGCARDPELAMRRNAEATRVLAEACVARDASMIAISTNEVFSGTRRDRRGYATTDPTEPANAYGASKLAGELAVAAAFAPASRAGGPTFGIVRTAWVFGPGKPDFPARIVAAAEKAHAAGMSLRLVRDEIGTPTYAPDLADAIVRLMPGALEGTHHIVNAGIASRAEWARDVLSRLGIAVASEEVDLATFDRPSRPPQWGVLEASPIPGGRLRSWEAAMADRVRQLRGLG